MKADKISQLNTRPSLRKYLALIGERRDYILADAGSKAFQQTRKFRLWQLWLIVEPTLNVAMYALLFGYLLQTSRGVENFLGYLTLGITFFGFMTSQINSGIGLIAKQRSMIRSFHFPRAILVFSDALRSILDSLVPAFVAVVFAVAVGLPESLNWTVVLIVPLFLMLHVFAVGIKFVVVRLTAFIPELKALIAVLIRAWFFSSGVFFNIKQFEGLGTVYTLLETNPGYRFLSAIREVVIYGQCPSWTDWLILLAWTIGMFIGGFIFFWKAEDRYVRVA